MKPCMYIFINEGLRMSPGKIAAQASHAAVEAYRISQPYAAPNETEKQARKTLLDAWYEGGHYMKLVMSARDSEHLMTIERYLNARGFKTTLIIDEGHTEIDPHQATALGVALVDKDNSHAAATFESFKLLRQPRPAPEPPPAGTYAPQKAPRARRSKSERLALLKDFTFRR